jgi:hypothetical protein
VLAEKRHKRAPPYAEYASGGAFMYNGSSLKGRRMSHTPEATGPSLVRPRTRADWQKAVLEQEAAKTDLDKDVFAYWMEIGYPGKLTPTDADAAALVAESLESLSVGPNNPSNDVRFLILGALTFAYARTNDVREFKGEPSL